jgi:LacI family transcriptional regulator
MRKKKSPVVSVGDVARAAGVSRGTACNVLLNRPGPSQKTRERIKALARRLGYSPDARAGRRMANVRAAKTKDLLPIAWLNTDSNKHAWRDYPYFAPYLAGATERARQLGFRLEELWLHEPGTTTRHISRILYQRGIEGVIVTQPANHVGLNLDHLAAISLEWNLLVPRLHRAMSDRAFNLMLALRVLKRFGYRRIGICLEKRFARFFAYPTWSIVHYFLATTPEKDRIPPVQYDGTKGSPREIQREALSHIKPWLKQHRPEVIVCHSNQVVDWVEKLGYRVPGDVGVVHLARDNDVPDWAGIDSKRQQVGALAAERVINLLQNHQFGIPESPVSSMIRGTWVHGRTLLTPKRK